MRRITVFRWQGLDRQQLALGKAGQVLALLTPTPVGLDRQQTALGVAALCEARDDMQRSLTASWR